MNQSSINYFFLSGLSDLPVLQLPLFLLFLLIYLLTLLWNLLIILLTVTNSHLHVPMYFFLANLASLDLCCSSVTVPRMLYDLHTKRRKIAATACLTQVFFFIFLATSEIFLLTVMSYDRYTAICLPLHYTQVMSWKVCVQLASIAWCLGFSNSVLHTLYTLKLSFCESQMIESFFCDLPQLFQTSCSDPFINIVLVLIVGILLASGPLILTFLSYISIFKTVLKMKGKSSKVFSTCTSHLMVVFIFYGSTMCNYFQPSNNHHFTGYKVVSVFYSVIVPLFNPLIYSLRNQDLRRAFQDFVKKIFSNAV